MDNAKAMELIGHLMAQNTAMHEMLEKFEFYFSNNIERWQRPEMFDVLDEFDEIKDEETPHFYDYIKYLVYHRSGINLDVDEKKAVDEAVQVQRVVGEVEGS